MKWQWFHLQGWWPWLAKLWNGNSIKVGCKWPFEFLLWKSFFFWVSLTVIMFCCFSLCTNFCDIPSCECGQRSYRKFSISEVGCNDISECSVCQFYPYQRNSFSMSWNSDSRNCLTPLWVFPHLGRPCSLIHHGEEVSLEYWMVLLLVCRTSTTWYTVWSLQRCCSSQGWWGRNLSNSAGPHY